MTYCVCCISILTDSFRFKNIYVIKCFFRALCYFCHRLHSLERIFTGRCFSAKHNCVCAIKNGISHITCFSSCSPITVNHAFQHLCCCYNRLTYLVAAFDNILLHQRYNLCWYFYSKVSACNHYTIRDFYYFFNIADSFFVFDFSNDTYLRAKFFSKFTNGKNVFCFLYKRSSNVIHILFDSKFNIRSVFDGNKW
ncbi:hypothetical protein SDC9_117293 [bioreactor metagenome]|uniref:Uncharacterized protein n=1 Tax=bioreactor metagenome TaxID=1076179 RepID=A0A645BZ05_9ZZZZ